MGLRSGNIPSLVQGVSQQPTTLRLPTQLELQENCYSSTVEGLIRRPPTEHVAKISDTVMENAFQYVINRDLAERYNVIIDNDEIKVFTIDGVEKTVNVADATFFILEGAVSTVTGQTYRINKAAGETTIDFTTAGITTATVLFELSVDGSVWTTGATRTTNGTTVGVAIGSNLFMRARVSAYTSGTISASVTYKHVRYLFCPTPKSQIGATTIADFTFIVNKTKTVEVTNDLSPERDEEGLVFVRAGNYGSTYQIFIDGTLRATYTTSATDVTTLKTEFIADELRDDLVAAGFNTAPWSTTLEGSTIWITNTTTNFTLQAVDSQGGTSLKAFKASTPSFTDLPATAPNGFVIRIDADAQNDEGSYYVEAVSNQPTVTFGTVTWTETLAPGIAFEIDPTTMPHTLVRETGGDFTFGPTVWTDRLVGDDESNETPSFVGEQINDIVFYKNRLGFFANENFVFSETAEYFNYWRTTVTQVLDTDRIDSRAVHTKVSILKHGIPFNTDLILFSDQTQFKIPGDVAFTPRTFRCDPVAEFEGNMLTKPVNAGKSIYFVFNREAFAGIKELFLTESISNVMDASDQTAHIPAYIQSGIFSLSVSTLEGITCVLTDGDPSSIYVYKTAFSPSDENKKVQAAWFKWPMGDGVTSTKVLGAQFIESILYLVVQRGTKVFQERIKLQPSRVDTGSTYLTHLDRRIDQTGLTRVYSIGTNSTAITVMPYDPDENTVLVSKAGVMPQVLSTGVAAITVRGDFSVVPIWIGQRYDSKAGLSTIYVRKQAATGGGLIIDEVSRLQLLRGYLNYSKSGYFKVSVTPVGRSTSDYIFTGYIVGSGAALIGEVALESGRFSFGIFSKNDRVQIRFSSNSFLPFSFTSMEWEGTYTKRSEG